MLPATFSAFELQPLPDGASTILRLLAAQAPNWPEIALVAARDPALSLALLRPFKATLIALQYQRLHHEDAQA